MLCHLLSGLVGALAAAPLLPLPDVAPTVSAPSSLPPTLADELVLEGDHVIEVTINDETARLEVDAEAFGMPIINPALRDRLKLPAQGPGRWIYGPVEVRGRYGLATTRFRDHKRRMQWSWADRPVSARADGVIGIHQLPYPRVTFVLGPEREGEIVQRLPLRREGGDVTSKVGASVMIGERSMMMVFALRRAENLVTAPTANFIATHQEGAFEPGAAGMTSLPFAIRSPVRMMQLAYAIELGDLLIDRFAVRIDDYGSANRVGEKEANDPRFIPGQILVTRRRGRGQPDYLTRIGRDQIAHCSRLTYDFQKSEIRLSCAAPRE